MKCRHTILSLAVAVILRLSAAPATAEPPKTKPGPAAPTQPARPAPVPAPAVKPDTPPAGAGAGLMEGLGDHHHPIATQSPEAQKFFDQGLNLVYAFNHDEAVRAFRRAAALDPKAAMPLWGVALALGPNINQARDPARDREACEAAQQAVALVANGPANEQEYVAAVAKRYSVDSQADRRQLDETYRDAMRDLARRHPDDLDAITLYAESIMDLNPWKFWSNDGKPAEGTDVIVALLESVLRRDPSHPGANHYYIHAVEASPHPERALPSARRLEGLAPAAGHLVHMPGHIYMRTGDYAASVQTNLKAVEADRAYFKSFGEHGMYPLMYYAHNLHFVAFGSMYEGRAADSLKWAEELRKSVAEGMPPGALPSDMVMMLEMYMAQPLFAQIRFMKWDEILRAPAPDPRLVVGMALWHAARATAYAMKRDFARAEPEKKDFEAARAKVSATAYFGFNVGHDILNIAGFMLDGRLLEARGDKDFALASWKSAVETQDGLAYNEPPDWFYPVRESLGGAYLRSGRAQEAERTFRADLERNPRNPRSLFGLWKALEAGKKTTDAALVKGEFEVAWKNADVTLRVEDL